jgi:hypothetical protein
VNSHALVAAGANFFNRFFSAETVSPLSTVIFVTNTYLRELPKTSILYVFHCLVLSFFLRISGYTGKDAMNELNHSNVQFTMETSDSTDGR